MFTCIERKMCSLIHKVKILLRKYRMKAFSVLPFFPTSTIPANTLIRTIIDLNKNLKYHHVESFMYPIVTFVRFF